VLYNLKEKDTRKKFPISELKYIVKSLTSKELLLYFLTDQDIRMLTDERDEFLNILKARFPHFCPNRNLKVYGIPKDSLKEFKAKARDQGFAFDNEPSAKFRLRDEEPLS
jgi:hypothetical protein